MSYFQAKSDLLFMRRYKQNVLELWRLESIAAKEAKSSTLYDFDFKKRVKAVAAKQPKYQSVREKVSRGTLRAIRIARKLGVPVDLQSCPPIAAGGGMVIPVNILNAILHDNSYGGIDNQMIYDALNQISGECESWLAAEIRHLFNPLYWIKALIIFIIRIPFMIVEASGFDVSKVEDHFLSKAFKLLEIGIIGYVVWRLKLEDSQLIKTILSAFGK